MSSYASGTTLQNLSLVDDGLPVAPPVTSDPTPGPGPTPSEPGPPRVTEKGDRFLEAALRELESGRIEQPLWVRAMDQAGGDIALARAGYLRARAAALRLERRARHTDEAARKEVAAIDAVTRAQDAPPERNHIRRASRGASAGGRKLAVAIAASAAALVLAVVGWLALSAGNDAPPAEQAAKAAAPKAPPPAAKEQDAAGRERGVLAGQELARKVQDLKAAENWHVMVLHAVEWTRAQPEDATAWQELAAGYVKLRQFDDAQEAARKATQLGPDDYRRWQELGQIDVALNQAVPALAAFERAVELNPRDVASLVQIGALRTQQGHLPEARAAYAKALDVNPADVDALCGAASIARKDGRAKDADALARQVASGGGTCADRAAAEAAAPAHPGTTKSNTSYALPGTSPAPGKPAAPARR